MREPTKPDLSALNRVCHYEPKTAREPTAKDAAGAQTRRNGGLLSQPARKEKRGLGGFFARFKG